MCVYLAMHGWNLMTVNEETRTHPMVPGCHTMVTTCVCHHQLVHHHRVSKQCWKDFSRLEARNKRQWSTSTKSLQWLVELGQLHFQTLVDFLVGWLLGWLHWLKVHWIFGKIPKNWNLWAKKCTEKWVIECQTVLLHWSRMELSHRLPCYLTPFFHRVSKWGITW